MDTMQAIRERHSVRAYTDRGIEAETAETLRQYIDDCNRQSGLHIQLCLEEPTAFSGMMARYGKFRGVRSYIALVGPQGGDLEEKGGYWGEKIVLRAQQLGLHTCWVAATYSKGKSRRVIETRPGEKLLMVIALGYGETPGVPHKSKPLEALYSALGELPDWFRAGVEAAQLAPTAMNQQKFHFELDGTAVRARPGSGMYTKVDLGIAKCHFEIGAGDAGWSWA